MIVDCQKCEARVVAEELESVEGFDPDEGPPYRYTFLRCRQCGSAILALQEKYSPDEWDGPMVVFPVQAMRVNPMLPSPLRSAMTEAVGCMKAKAFTACAIMCRKTLEGVCAEHGIKERSLDLSLKKMKDQGIIESRLFEWADALRIAGNEAAHDVKVTVSREDAKDIIEFTSALLEYVFTFRDRFEAFMKRRGCS